MAPSLQVLIDFLLAEIALCGDQGRSFFFFLLPCAMSIHYCRMHVGLSTGILVMDSEEWMILGFPSTA